MRKLLQATLLVFSCFILPISVYAITLQESAMGYVKAFDSILNSISFK